MVVLGIETSCDETAVAVVCDADVPKKRILSNVILSQHEAHRPFGGVVPEIAARSHLLHIDYLMDQALKSAGLSYHQLDGIAVTGGPGLIGGLIVGVMCAKTVAMVYDTPFLAVNHLEGHALTARLTDNINFPYLLLLVSGGHTQLLIVEGVGNYELLGTTVDDAVGEAFDKSAKLLGIGYPGGPEIEKVAKTGDPHRFKLPRPMFGRPNCNFSFSGLKTAVREQFLKIKAGQHSSEDISDLCASFQTSVVVTVADRCRKALDVFLHRHNDGKSLVIAGGVASNESLRKVLEAVAIERGMSLVAPPPVLCTDNGAMIAWAGLERLKMGLTDDLDFAPRPRWPLDPSSSSVSGAGQKV